MAAAVLTLVTALAFSVIFRKRLIETAGAAVFAVTLAVYAFALFLPLSYAVIICAVLSVCALAAAVFLSRRRDMVISLPIRGYIAPVIFIAVCAVLCALMSYRRVFYYDDLSYWGLYTKNIFSIGKLPHLYENCSVSYKDYTPIMQILQYLALFGRKSFSEPVLFMTNVCFIYIMLLPMLKGIDDAEKPLRIRVAAAVFYIIFPHILTAQFYYRLGVDLFLALVFGYCLCFIFSREKIGTYGMMNIMLSIAFLSLIKTSGIVLCIFAVIFFIVRSVSLPAEDVRQNTFLKNAARSAIVCLSAAVPYVSWQLFLRISWNNGYLSNRVKDGIKGGFSAFPGYTGEVIRNYLVHFVSYPLTRNAIGVTALSLLIFIIAAYVVTRRKGTGDAALFAAGITLLVIFMAAHTGMYLFVFDEWEAHGLLEFDRYITQYLGGLFFVYSVRLITSAYESRGRADKAASIVLAASLAAFIILLPYADIRQYLFPDGYRKMFDEEYAGMAGNAESEWARSHIADMGLKHDGSQRLTVFADVWDETTQFMEYCAVPQPIDSFVNVPAIEAGTIASFADDFLEDYVYVAKNAEASYTGDWSETAELTEDSEPLKGGGLYIVVKENGTKTLRPAE